MTIDDLAGARIYLDTNVIIHFVEGHVRFRGILDALFQAHENAAVQLCTSELSLAEVLVKPLIETNEVAVEKYKELLSAQSQLETLPVSREILIGAAQVRASWGGKPFDAIHVATALQANADYFLSEDTRIKGPSSFRILRLGDLVIAL